MKWLWKNYTCDTSKLTFHNRCYLNLSVSNILQFASMSPHSLGKQERWYTLSHNETIILHLKDFYMLFIVCSLHPLSYRSSPPPQTFWVLAPRNLRKLQVHKITRNPWSLLTIYCFPNNRLSVTQDFLVDVTIIYCSFYIVRDFLHLAPAAAIPSQCLTGFS